MGGEWLVPVQTGTRRDRRVPLTATRWSFGTLPIHKVLGPEAMQAADKVGVRSVAMSRGGGLLYVLNP